MNCKDLDKRTKAYKDCVKNIDVEVDLVEPNELGDTVERVLEATGIAKIVKAVVGEDCGCQQRKEWLNNQSLMKNLVQYDCMTDDEAIFINGINLSGSLTPKDLNFLFDIYSKVFNVNISNQCVSCGGTGKKLVRFIKQLRNTLKK